MLDLAKFLQLHIHAALQSSKALRLLVESVALWGALQLLLDQHLPAAARERAVVAHVRAVLASTGEGSDAALQVERCLPGVLALICSSPGQGMKGAASAGEQYADQTLQSACSLCL